ncbi:hypothetical protein LIER_24232 [Lithospermum erythrorhizon]|uniref:S-type anion channel SLAH2-like n=1 Tax=Lithospermum erythrorhizon TaxID=34254 RepID=A0AAV3R3K4_LITER
MEIQGQESSRKENSLETVPSQMEYVATNGVDGFDSIKETTESSIHSSVTEIQSCSPSIMETQSVPSEKMHSVSVSMPSTPNTGRVMFKESLDDYVIDSMKSTMPTSKYPSPKRSKKSRFYSQPMPKGVALNGVSASSSSQPELLLRNHGTDRLKDKRYDSFKTWSGKLERQLTLRGRSKDQSEGSDSQSRPDMETLPVDRYFDALQGPELETLRPSEEIILPEDKQWPFLLRYPISSFGICLGISSQAIMWKSLATSASTKFLNLSLNVNLVLWCISVALVAIVAFIYALKLIFYFEAVRREYYHPIRINFFFAPWIALLFLAIGVPPSVTKDLHAALWYVLMAPIFCLELKIYGQWMSGGQRRLSKVANPTNHLSIVGNFVGALLGASMGLKEGPVFFFAVGMAHYIVLFVTLYQRLPTNETLPKELHPVFFLFVAAPSVASMAWANIQGSFEIGSRICYFIGMFLYLSLAVRVNFFRGFRFSLAWWAYTFPMTGAAIATIRYSNVVTNTLTKCLAVALSILATLIVTSLLVTTIIHAIVLHDLFPNDIAIAISETKHKTRRWYHRRNGTSEAKHIEHFLRHLHSDDKDIEAGVNHPSSTDQETTEVHINRSATS